MRTIRRPVLLAALAGLICYAAFHAAASAATIEAVKGKQYRLTKRHGPWMIMVASFSQPPEERRTEGMSPEQAADELVYELRLKGIPAYTFKQEEIDSTITTVSRRTQAERQAKIRSWAGGICVLAGNYHTSSDPVAQRTLKYIKKFQPRFLSEVAFEGDVGPDEKIKRTKSGGVFHVTHFNPGPLSGAFMTTNPILSDDDLAVRKRDPFLLRINAGSEYSLLQNPGKFTVIVATFQGKSEIGIGNAEKKKPLSSALGEAADRAWELCTALRNAKSYGYDHDYDAWVYHDRYTSIVTVGSFQSKDDPRIAATQDMFGAKVAGMKSDGSPRLGAEAFAVPKVLTGSPSDKTWIFDPFPRLMEVPR